MTRDQLIFGQWFENHRFGPRNGFDPRRWQIECLDAYDESIDGWLAAHEGNGGAGQHQFTVYGGTGSGKTKAAGLLAVYLLNRRLVDQVVVVCPNRSILRKTRKDLYHQFGVELVPFHKRKHGDGIPRTKQGYALTYQHLMQDPSLHRRICVDTPTLVVFDEVHHLGDHPESGWGDSATEAYGLVRCVISLTGTPYRSDNTRIPFVRYEDAGADGLVRFKADFPYKLGRAVAEGVCRKPIFIFHRAEVQIRTSLHGGYRVVSFDDTDVDEVVGSLRLRGAAKYGSIPRRAMLAAALLRCREERRKVVIFLGGDTEGDQTPTTDAKEFLPAELQDLGIDPSEYEVVTGGDKDEAPKKIEEFGASSKWILVSINMVSEGVDIPELSAAIFLTSVTAKQTTIQRIGRVLRRLGEDDPQDSSLIFMFRDPHLVELAKEIEDEVQQEIDLRREPRQPREGDGDGQEPHSHRTEAIGIAGGEAVMVSAHCRDFPIERVRETQAELRNLGLPDTLTMATMRLLFKELDHVA